MREAQYEEIRNARFIEVDNLDDLIAKFPSRKLRKYWSNCDTPLIFAGFKTNL